MTRDEFYQRCANLASDLRSLADRIERLPERDDPVVPGPIEQGSWLSEELQMLSHDSRNLDPLL